MIIEKSELGNFKTSDYHQEMALKAAAEKGVSLDTNLCEKSFIVESATGKVVQIDDYCDESHLADVRNFGLYDYFSTGYATVIQEGYILPE